MPSGHGDEAREIAGFPGYYVTKAGDVYHVKEDREPVRLKPIATPKGYLKFHLRGPDGVPKWKFAHRLVIETWTTPLVDGRLEANHKDENKANNHLDNLEWVTHQSNMDRWVQRRRATA